MNINLNEPKTLTLSPQSIVAIMQALNELPYKIARPVVDEIVTQLQAPPEPAPVEPEAS